MAESFSILGRGRAGRALAEAWADRAMLLPHDAEPEGPVLLAVPDDAIAGLAGKFTGRCAHLSGSLHMAGVPSLHPLTSFNGRAAQWAGTPLAVTGEAPVVFLDAFMGLGFLPFELPAELKPLYHACAVLTSGHASTLWVGAARLMADQGVALPGKGFLPLAEASLRNIEAHGEQGRTGPFVRGDEGTIARDAEALPEAWREVFLRLGRM
ncbi:MAG: DUF2520 domain-containing protein [Acidobacteria bacterium]|nr:DUF2520 domain-containing protein [Acidobacteriota bacterium]